MKTERSRSVATYLATVLLSLAILTVTLQLWRADLRMPLIYAADALCMQAWVKGLVEHGWYLENPSLGAPFQLEMYDFPLVDGLFFTLLKLVGRFASDPFLTINLYYFATYPLAAVSALAVFRSFRVSRGPAMVGGLLFAFLPYHFVRGETHLLLASYYLVPLATLVCLRFSSIGSLAPGESLDGPRPAQDRRQWLRYGAICLLLGFGGIYYAFFTSVLIAVIALRTALERKSLRIARGAALLLGAIALGVLINLVPKLLHDHRWGPNPDAVVRNWAQVDVLSLRMTDLLLPVVGHRIPAFARWRTLYNAGRPLLGAENPSAALGVICSLGFLALLFGYLRSRRNAPGSVWDGLCQLNLAILLLSLAGGVGTVLGFAFLTTIRAYNRSCIFLAFFSVFAVALGLQRLQYALAPTRWRHLGGVGLAAILALGLLDQTSPRFVPLYDEIRASFTNDAQFARSVEEHLPPGSSVFQLPYTEFPEGIPKWTMALYDGFRPYLHSSSLKWSFAAMKGRYAAHWQANMTDKPPDEMATALAFAGFGGIAIDRRGYSDHGASLEAALRQCLAVAPVESPDGHMAFYSLEPYAAALRRSLSPERWAAGRDAVLHQVLATFRGGFGHNAGVATDGQRLWCDVSGEIILSHPWSRPCDVELRMAAATRTGETARLRIKGPRRSDDYTIGADDREIRLPVTVPPGGLRLRVSCNGPRVQEAGKPLAQVFRLDHFTLCDVGPASGGAARTAGSATAAARGRVVR